MIHIGEKIKQVLYEKRLTSVQLAKLMGKSPRTIRQLLCRKTTSVKLLEQLSEVLDHDFFRYYVKPLPGQEIAQLKSDNELLKRENEMLQREVALLKDVLKNR